MKITAVQRQLTLAYCEKVYTDPRHSAIVRIQAINAHNWLDGLYPVPAPEAAELMELVTLVNRSPKLRRQARRFAARTAA